MPTHRRQKQRERAGNWRNDWSREELEVLERLERAVVMPTRWACPNAMDRMGITDDVGKLLNDMGWPNLHTYAYPTYAEPTLHFISSVATSVRDGEGEVGRLTVSFRIRDVRYEIPIGQFCEAWEIPEGNARRYQTIPAREAFWTTLSDDPWESSKSKNFYIRNPAIRYVARLLANTVFARIDPRKVKTDEVAMLHRALRRHLDLPPAMRELLNSRRGPVDNACVLIYCLITARNRYARNPAPAICIGGMLTPLFRYVGVNLKAYDPVPEHLTMDLDYLKAKEFCPIYWEGEGYIHNFHIDGKPTSCRLPLSRFVEITHLENIQFRLPADVCFDTPEIGSCVHQSDDRENESGDNDPIEPDEEPQFPSPDRTKKGRKWYQIHKFQGKKIKELLAEAVMWRKTADSIAGIKADMRKLQEEMKCMRLGQLSDVRTPVRRTSSPPRSSASFQHREESARATPRRRSTSDGSARESRRRRLGKNIATEAESRRDTAMLGSDFDPSILRAFDDPNRYYGGTSNQG